MTVGLGRFGSDGPTIGSTSNFLFGRRTGAWPLDALGDFGITCSASSTSAVFTASSTSSFVNNFFDAGPKSNLCLSAAGIGSLLQSISVPGTSVRG